MPKNVHQTTKQFFLRNTWDSEKTIHLFLDMRLLKTIRHTYWLGWRFTNQPMKNRWKNQGQNWRNLTIKYRGKTVNTFPPSQFLERTRLSIKRMLTTAFYGHQRSPEGRDWGWSCLFEAATSATLRGLLPLAACSSSAGCRDRLWNWAIPETRRFWHPNNTKNIW